MLKGKLLKYRNSVIKFQKTQAFPGIELSLAGFELI
jgi:hypothetical protein